jgi:HK97 gp10 family phage protein|nr:MAG TPA: putative tail component [Caudoviricetes sp.]
MSESVTVKDNTEEFEEALQNAIERGLEAIGSSAETHAKTNVRDFPRVDTGRLMNSISHATTNKAAYIGTNVEYALYVEEGTRKMAAAHYLRNAATQNAEEYKKLLEDSLRNA